MHKGESQLLRRMLQHRFGPALPGWVEERLAAASTDQLEAWGLAFVPVALGRDHSRFAGGLERYEHPLIRIVGLVS